MDVFFLFGCWNQGANCSKQQLSYFEDNRATVIKSILERRQSYQFGIVAGDNAYPSYKAGSHKVYTKSVVSKGFKMLAGLGLPLHIIYGNHDVDSQVIQEFQERVVTKYPNMQMHRFAVRDTAVARYIFLDTNTPVDIKILLHALSESKWTIVVGHEPLAAFKNKKGSSVVFSSNGESVIAALSRYRNVVYMGADVHNFQVLQANGLPIVVVGTGGAKPDPQPDMAEAVSTNQRTHLRLHATAAPFGYCSIRITPDLFECTYHQVTASETQVCNTIGVRIDLDRRIHIAAPRLARCDAPKKVRQTCDLLNIVSKT